MKLLQRLFGNAVPATSQQPLEQVRFVVVDVETTGLDPRRDTLLSIGFVPVGVHGITLAGLREILLWHEADAVDKDNILVHGITPTESARGRDTAAALREFVDYIADDCLIAFHADFDRMFLNRALKRELGIRLKNPFIDLAWLLPALFSEAGAGLHTLDDWLAHFHLEAPYRHRAAADALVTAELLLVALNAAQRQHYDDVDKLARLARAQSKLSCMAQAGMPPL